MPTVDLTKSSEILTGYDNVIIPRMIEDIRGGKTLDVTGIAETTIGAGRVIIVETATGVMKPLGITGATYDAKPAGHNYHGIVYVTIPTTGATASIMLRGNVNEKAAVEYGLPVYPAAVKTALSLIIFGEDGLM